MNEITKEEVRDRLGNIDQIRDIIFGAQLRDYDTRLHKLEADQAVLQQEMRDRSEQIKNSFSIELKNAIESLEKKLKSFNIRTQEENVELRQHIDHLNKKFSNHVAALDESLDQQTSSLREELIQTRNQLQDDSTTLKDLVFEELNRHFSSLKDVKLSKDDMAEALFELGMKLKGTEFIPKLQEAANNSNDNGSDNGSDNRNDSDYVHLPLLETKRATEVMHTS